MTQNVSDQTSEISDHILELLTLLVEANGKIPNLITGATLYVDPTGRPHCVNLTEAQSRALGARWDPATCCKFSGPAGVNECQAQ